MVNNDKRVDAYIDKAGEYAKPVLAHIRGIVHMACPGIQETIKWGCPAFDYKGPVCQMAAFKAHCSIVFWKASLMKDAAKFEAKPPGETPYLRKIIAVADLPADKVLIALIKEAALLNTDDVKKVIPAKQKITTETPDYFLKELKKNKKSLQVFESFPPSQCKEYNQWIVEAKSDETRNRRILQAIEWLAEGKVRNWKYVK